MKIRKIIFLFVLALFFSKNVFALQRGLESFSFRPAADVGNYFGVWSSKNLHSFEWKAGTFLTYEYRPLQLTQNGNRAQGIIDHSVIQHFYGSLGLVNQWLSIGLELPVGWLVDFRDPNVAGSTFSKDVAIGDLRLNFKTELYRSRCERFGLALVPFIDIPTGYGDKYFGNGTVSGGGLFVIEAQPFQRFHFSFNAGASDRSEFNFRDIERKAQLLLGFGAKFKLSKVLSLNTEIQSQTRLTGIYQEAVESPTEVLAGLKWKVAHTGLVASLGAGLGITHGSTSPGSRVFMGLSYSPFKRNLHKLRHALENTIVHFDSGKSVIHEDEMPKLNKLASLLNKTYDLPLTIEGHTDNIGSFEYNASLSKQRAQSVSDYLTKKKIKKNRISIELYSETRPVESNTDELGRSANRRVSFEKKTCCPSGENK